MDWKKKLDIKDKYSNVIINDKFDLTVYCCRWKCNFYRNHCLHASAIMGKKTISYNIKNVKTLRNYANKCVPNTTDFKTLIKYLNKKSKFENYKYKKKLKRILY